MSGSELINMANNNIIAHGEKYQSDDLIICLEKDTWYNETSWTWVCLIESENGTMQIPLPSTNISRDKQFLNREFIKI